MVVTTASPAGSRPPGMHLFSSAKKILAFGSVISSAFECPLHCLTQRTAEDVR